MKRRVWLWLHLLLGGALLFATSGSSCFANVLRDASDELNNAADDMDPQGSSVSSFLQDLQNAFD